MTQERLDVARDVAAIAVAALACPLALFGGALLGCAAQGFSATCAMSAIFVSPPALIAAGLLAAALTRGWWGYVWIAVGVVVGMVLIFILTFVGGTLLPVDPATGTIATMWFLAPVSVGYLLGRGGARFVRAWSGGGDEDSRTA